MLLEVFTDSSMPFYKFGELLYLRSGRRRDLIRRRFNETGGEYRKTMRLIAQLAENHLLRAAAGAAELVQDGRKCNREIILSAREDIVGQLIALRQHHRTILRHANGPSEGNHRGGQYSHGRRCCSTVWAPQPTW